MPPDTIIDRTFLSHIPTDAATAKVDQLRIGYSSLKAGIEQLVPPSRERSVALTELETSAMWATKAIVVNDPSSTPVTPRVD